MKNIITIFFLSLITVQLMAQEEDTGGGGFKRENLFVGGNFGFSFGSSITHLNLSPQVGYRVSRFFAAGAGVNGIYTSFKRGGYKENYGVAGLNVFGRVFPIENIILQLQPEMNYTWGTLKYDDNRADVRLDGKVVPSLIGGVGAVLPTGGRGGFMVMLQYDILQNARSPYSNRPFVNIGYVVGL